MTDTADTPPVFDLTPDDIPPDTSGDREPLRCKFDGCTNAVVKPSRGRTPRFCPDHRKQGAGPTGQRKASWPEAESVELGIGFALRSVGAGVMLLNPADGKVIAVGSPAVAHEIVELLRKPKFRKYRDIATKLTAPGDYGPLFLSLLPIVMTILANHNLVPQFMFSGLTQTTPSPTDTEGV